MSRSIITNASRCIGCHTCGVAYVVSHQENQDHASPIPETLLPRIHVIKGMNISTVTICHQCKDVPCANIYSNDATSRDKGFVHVTQECCIGRKTCMVVCPYGATEVAVRPMVHNSGAGLNVRADKAEANKCDLCNHRGDGPVCVAACPTHTLICADRNKFEQLSAEKCCRMVLMFQKSHRTALASKEFPGISVEYGAGGIADLRPPDTTQSCPVGRIT